MIVYFRIIGHVIHPQIFILLWLLIDVMLSSSSESFYKSKVKGKSKRASSNVLIDLKKTNRVEILNLKGTPQVCK
jgi:hypothetical protein